MRGRNKFIERKHGKLNVCTRSQKATESEEDMSEAYNTAPLMNVRNQLMNTLGSHFDFIGGSMMPKFTITYKDNPKYTFDVSLNGSNIEMTPKYDNEPDYTNKIKGIAIMRAANVILDKIKSIIKMNESVNRKIKLMIRESDY